LRLGNATRKLNSIRSFGDLVSVIINITPLIFLPETNTISQTTSEIPIKAKSTTSYQYLLLNSNNSQKFGVPRPVTGSHPFVAFQPAFGIYGVGRPE
jgi:hypothetical protein